MSTTVQIIRNRAGVPIIKDDEIPFKSGGKIYLASLVAALAVAVVVMWSLFVL
jgi:hypothetical protein